MATPHLIHADYTKPASLDLVPGKPVSTNG